MRDLLAATVLWGLFFTSCGDSNVDAGEPVSAKPEVELIAEGHLRYIELSGTPYEIGFSHGSMLKNEIRAVTDSLRIDIEKVTQMNPDEFISKFLKETDFVNSMKKWTPELLDEIK